MHWNLHSLAIGLVCFSGLFSSCLEAQVLYGSVVGTVEIKSGAVVPGAAILLTSKGTGQTREITSDTAGRFSVPNVQPGSYELKVTAQGFRSFVDTAIGATANTVTRIDVKLEIGATTEQVTISGSAALLQTDKADVHMELGAREVTSLPLGGYRNYQSLIDLVPGATPSTTQNSIQELLRER